MMGALRRRARGRGAHPPAGSVPEMNLLPPGLRRPPLVTPRSLVLLVALLEVLGGVAIYQARGPAAVEGAVGFLSGLVQRESPEAARIVRLERVLANLRQDASNLRAAVAEVQKDRRNWAFLLQEVFARSPEGASVEVVRQTVGGVAVTGRAPDIPAVDAYRDRLLEMPEVQDVVVTGVQQDPRSREMTFSFDIRLR